MEYDVGKNYNLKKELRLDKSSGDFTFRRLALSEALIDCAKINGEDAGRKTITFVPRKQER